MLGGELLLREAGSDGALMTGPDTDPGGRTVGSLPVAAKRSVLLKVAQKPTDLCLHCCSRERCDWPEVAHRVGTCLENKHFSVIIGVLLVCVAQEEPGEAAFKGQGRRFQHRTK